MRTALLVSLALLASSLAFAAPAQADGQLMVYTNTYYFGTGDYDQLVVSVYDEFGGAVTTADVQLICPNDCGAELGAWPTAISGNGQMGRGAFGEYWFDLVPSTPGIYSIQASAGEPASTGYAIFEVVESDFEIAGVQVPNEAFVGQMVDIGADILNLAPAGGSFEAYLVVNGNIAVAYGQYLPAWSSTFLAFPFAAATAGNHTVSILLSTGESSGDFTIVVLPPAKLASADIAASSVFSTTAPLVLQDANAFKGGIFQLRYDPALVEVRSIAESDVPGLGSVIDHDAEAGVVTLYIGSALPLYGDLTLASIEYAAVELHNTDSTLAFDVLSYERAGGPGFVVGGSAHFHGSVLGATGDDVLRLL